MSFVRNTSFALDVARGLHSNISVVHKFGRNAAIAQSTEEVIWAQSGSYVFPDAASVATCVSSSAQDAAGGTGAAKIMLEGLDSTWAAATEEVTLTGQSNATSTTSWIRINRVYITETGSTAAYTAPVNAGNISITVDGGVVAYIAASRGQTQQCVYTVPLGKQAYFYGGWVHATGGNDSIIRLYNRQNADDVSAPFTGTNRIGFSAVFNDGVNAAFPLTFPSGPFPAKTDIWVTGEGSGGATAADVMFELVLVDV